LLVAKATAEGLATIANSISENAGGADAVNLRLAEQYIAEFGKLAKEGTTMVLPSNLVDVASVLKVATNVIQKK
jgi:regulator of protease activity HflC (stomatin/prohibitin superfamily)